jgi:hypothetical protein
MGPGGGGASAFFSPQPASKAPAQAMASQAVREGRHDKDEQKRRFTSVMAGSFVGIRR